MPENIPKIPQSPSPVARAGAGDISERELSRERYNLQTTPPARLQPAHPKKPMFSTPVSKFSAKGCIPSPNLARIRSCLHDYKREMKMATPHRPVEIGPKAISMEDLTPTKRNKRDRNYKDLPVVRSPGLRSVAEEEAAARIHKFLLVVVWRRRRQEVKCLRKTLEFQLSCSERLRMQVSALKSLLDSDTAKVRLAMREIDRLKQLLKDKEMEKAVLEREKTALEGDVSAAEDRASEMSIAWRNCRNELEGVRASLAAAQRALSAERAAAADARAQRQYTHAKLEVLEEELAEYKALLAEAEGKVEVLCRETDEKQQALKIVSEQLVLEIKHREECEQRQHLSEQRVLSAETEAAAARAELETARADLARVTLQLEWWPRPLTRILGAARWWFSERASRCVPAALLGALVPATRGC